MTTFQWGLASDVGQVRSVNQDNALAFNGFFAVADGMGGHRGGEVASEIAVDILQSLLPMVSIGDVFEAIYDANSAILSRAAAEPDLRGMGTTVCVLALVEDEGEARLAVANVGDSRVYQFADGVLEQMTEDHSMVAELVRQGRITEEEAGAHPQRNIVTRALGVDDDVVVDAWKIVPYAGDRWLLCSDGLFNEVDEERIASVLGSVRDPNAAAEELVRLANESGGRDNVTVLVVDVLEADDYAATAVADAAGQPSHPINTARRAMARPGVTEAPPASGGAEGRAVGTVDSKVPVSVPLDDEPTDRATATTASAASTAQPLPVAQAPTGPGTSSERNRRSLGAVLVDSWRVVLFVLAIAALAAAAIGAWVAYGNDEDDPPVPVATTSTMTPAVTTTSVTASTTTPSTSVGSGASGASGLTNALGASGPTTTP